MVIQKSYSFLWSFILFVSVAAWGLQGQAPGVVVEKVIPNSEAEKAGIRAGDILSNWSRADARGQIESPFDLAQIEIEQAPRGKVTLEGLWGTERRSWTIGPAVWGIETRPNFQGKLLGIYQQGQELSVAGKFREAAARWREGAVEAKSNPAESIGPWLLFHAADMLAKQSQFDDADDAYQQAVQMAEKTDSQVVAQLCQAWADSFRQRSDWDHAEKYYQQAVAEAGKSEKENLMVALIFSRLGSVVLSRGELSKAEEYYRQSLDISQKLAPGSLSVAASFMGLGNVTEERGDLAKAEQYHLEALKISQKLAPHSLFVVWNLNNLGNVLEDREDLPKAEEYYRQALEISEKIAPGSMEVATSLNNLGNVAGYRRDLAKAEEYYSQALAIQQKLAPGSLDVAASLSNLGAMALVRGDLTKAEEYQRQALEIRQKKAPGSMSVAVSLSNLAVLIKRQGDRPKAERYYRQALEISQRLAPGSIDVAIILDSLGGIANDRKDLAKAEAYFREATTIAEKLAPNASPMADSLKGLAAVAHERHDLAKAEQYGRRAVAIQEKLAPGSIDHAEALAALASILRDKQEPAAAARLFEQALAALETQTTHLGGSQDARSEFRATHSGYFKDYIDLLIAQKKIEEAFHIAERWRARSLLEMLAAARVDIHHGADPGLLERERSLQQSLDAKRDRRILLLTSNSPPEQVAGVEREIEALRAEYEQIEGRIRATSPAYAALTQPQPLTLKDVQGVLDDETLLLEYSLGKERSYVWAVTSTTFTAHKLPKRSLIEATARHLYKLTSVLKDTEGRNQRQATLNTTAAVLSRMILGPIAEQLQGKRLLIIADGALQYIPFALLPEPGEPRGDPLILHHEIVYSPSASVLAELRREATGRKPAPKAVAVLADPVFDREDPRVRASQETTKAQTGETTPLLAQHVSRSVADVGLDNLSRLAFSRREADAIMKLIPAGQGLEAIDFEASRSTATSGDLAHYRVVHFATHALSDNRHPELSGLVLSLVDQQGKPQNGFLDLQDIYNLDLPAELVVLSACETALGKEIQGEGLIGLTRGFMYAGATRVVASLWNVDDASTRELMERFYRAMEIERMRPAEALRAAQVAMWKQQRWKNPYYWAAFEIQGEWN